MSDPKLLAQYGLKFNPFSSAIPAEDLWHPPGAEDFFFRVETLIMDGGFALLGGDPGLGKSKVLQLLAGRLEQIGEVIVGVMERPQSSLSDFYRELGDLFGVNLTPANRYGGFKALRARWRSHIKSSLFRPVLLIDEAQAVLTPCLNELRLLGSAHFDSECLLTTVLCGDMRLPDRFRSRELLPLGSRIRTRFILEPLNRDDLLDYLDHILERAGAPQLITESLQHTLVDHAAGNPRVLTAMGAELLDVAARSQRPQLDETFHFRVSFATTLRPFNLEDNRNCWWSRIPTRRRGRRTSWGSHTVDRARGHRFACHAGWLRWGACCRRCRWRGGRYHRGGRVRRIP